MTPKLKSPPDRKLRWVRGWDLARSIYLVKRTPGHQMDVNFSCGNIEKQLTLKCVFTSGGEKQGVGLGETMIDRDFSLGIRVAVWCLSIV